ncbi:MAG: NAD-dependent malic enzyme [Pseudomonadota bacterium]
MTTPNTKRGIAILKDHRTNKGSAFTEAERDALGLRGLLPPRASTGERQLARVLENLRRKESDIEKYIFLQALSQRNERLFYQLCLNHIDEILPLIYTPTVGQACLEFAHIYRDPRGLYVTARDRGRVAEVLANWPEDNVQVVVVTDGERILGLGDLGANGMGIPIGKLALYCALAGIDPQVTMPIMLDVGTGNESLRADPLYMGLDTDRLRGADYDELVEELIEAIQDRYPGCLIQFEDFATPNAIALLDRYIDRCLCFNDDIQGTAAVALAGVYASTRLSGIDFADLKIMFLGAGSSATGMGDLMLEALVDAGVPRADAKTRLLYCDSGGLVVASRKDKLAAHKQAYAHDLPWQPFEEAIDTHQPHVLIGATGSPNQFSDAVIASMARHHARPTIFALSNPTSRAECTAQQAYEWSEGRAIFASGSPFDPVTLAGKTHVPGQGNNAYIFPGIGLGAVAVGLRTLPSAAFLLAAKTLAELVDASQLAVGTLYPPLADIRAVSLGIATAVAEFGYANDLAGLDRPTDLRAHIADLMYDPSY